MPIGVSGKMDHEEFAIWCERPENDGKSFELIHGKVNELSRPGEEHGMLSWWIAHILTEYVLKRGKGTIMTNDVGLYIADDVVLGPDIALFTDTIPRQSASRKISHRVPALCVEIRSPSDQMSQLIRKIQHYFSRGVSLVWIVDPEFDCVQVHRRDEYARVLDESDTLSGNGIMPEFSCAVADLFRLPGTVG